MEEEVKKEESSSNGGDKQPAPSSPGSSSEQRAGTASRRTSEIPDADLIDYAVGLCNQLCENKADLGLHSPSSAMNSGMGRQDTGADDQTFHVFIDAPRDTAYGGLSNHSSEEMLDLDQIPDGEMLDLDLRIGFDPLLRGEDAASDCASSTSGGDDDLCDSPTENNNMYESPQGPLKHMLTPLRKMSGASSPADSSPIELLLSLSPHDSSLIDLSLSLSFTPSCASESRLKRGAEMFEDCTLPKRPRMTVEVDDSDSAFVGGSSLRVEHNGNFLKINEYLHEEEREGQVDTNSIAIDEIFHFSSHDDIYLEKSGEYSACVGGKKARTRV